MRWCTLTTNISYSVQATAAHGLSSTFLVSQSLARPCLGKLRHTEPRRGSPSPAPAVGEQGRGAGTGARGGKRLSAAPASMVWYGHSEKKQNGDSVLLLFLLELFLSIPNNIYEPSPPPQLALKKSTLLSFCLFCPLGHEFYLCTCPRRESLWMSRYTGTGPKKKKKKSTKTHAWENKI